MASMPGLIYAQNQGGTILVNLYVSSTADFPVSGATLWLATQRNTRSHPFRSPAADGIPLPSNRRPLDAPRTKIQSRLSHHPSTPDRSKHIPAHRLPITSEIRSPTIWSRNVANPCTNRDSREPFDFEPNPERADVSLRRHALSRRCESSIFLPTAFHCRSPTEIWRQMESAIFHMPGFPTRAIRAF